MDFEARVGDGEEVACYAVGAVGDDDGGVFVEEVVWHGGGSGGGWYDGGGGGGGGGRVWVRGNGGVDVGFCQRNVREIWFCFLYCNTVAQMS